MTTTWPRLFLVAWLGGCTGFRVDDSFSLGLDGLFGPGGDHLASPYLLGATFDLEVVGRDELVRRLSFESDVDAGLVVGPMRVDEDPDPDRRFARAEAVAAGDVEVRVVDDGGRVRRTLTLTVGTPTRVTLHPVARLVADDASPDPMPSLVVGGKAKIELHPFDGESLLSGSAPVLPDLAEGLGIEAGQYHLSNLHNVVAITPSAPGDHAFVMPFPGGPQEVSVRAIPADDVAALDVACLDDSDADPKDLLYCLAMAHTAAGDDVWGVAPSWEIDGTPLKGTGDLLSYEWDGRTPTETTATFGALAVRTPVLAKPNTAAVGTTNNMVACSHVGPRAWWLTGVMLWLGRRRRRGGCSADVAHALNERDR